MPPHTRHRPPDLPEPEYVVPNQMGRVVVHIDDGFRGFRDRWTSFPKTSSITPTGVRVVSSSQISRVGLWLYWWYPMFPSNEQLEALIKRIVSTQNPLRVVLYGSAARGEMTEGSDIDIMVIVLDGLNRRKVAMRLHQSFIGLPFPVDVVVSTPSLLEDHKHNMGLIYRAIIEEGREVYAA